MPIVAVGAILFSLGVALGQATGAPVWVGIPLGLVGLSLLYRGPRQGLAFAGTLLAAGLVAGSPTPARPLPPFATGRVIDAPLPVGGQTRLLVEAETGARFRLSIQGAADRVGFGDRIAARVAVRGIRGFANPGLPDVAERAALLSIRGSAHLGDARALVIAGSPPGGLRRAIERARDRVRAVLVRELGEPARGVMRAMVLGEGAALTPDAATAYRRSGTMHVLAVSGLHLVFVAAALNGLFVFLLRRSRRLTRRTDVRRWAGLPALPAIAAYAVFAGGEPSAVRATLMAIAYLAARMTGRPGIASAALGLSAMAQLAWWPERLQDPGLQLSYVAVLSLMLVAPALRDRLAPPPAVEDDPGSRPWRVTARRAAAGLLATNVAACLATAPLIATHFGQVTPAALVANVVAVPASGFILLPLGLAIALATPLHPALATVLCAAAQVCCDALTFMVALIARVPGASVEVPPLPGVVAMALVALLLTITWGGARSRRVRIAAILLLAVGPASLRRIDRVTTRELRLTVLDVGQGDASVLELPGGGVVLIDAGGLPGALFDTGEMIVRPYLRARGVGALARVVLSHPHPDHYGGMVASLAGMGVGAFWDNGQGRFERMRGPYPDLRRRLSRRRVRIVEPPWLCGRPWRSAGVKIEVLAPCPHHDPDLDLNDNSLVLSVVHGRVRLLFAGDLEAAGEARLLASIPDLRADLVKVPHHGSATSSGEGLVRATRPKYAVISVGARNRFGHPADAVLRRWREAGAKVLRTDVDGGLVFVSDGENVRCDATGRGTAR